MRRPLYMFIDEGGNLDFSPTGTAYFTLTSVTGRRPFSWDAAITALRFDLIEEGVVLERFHASEDRQSVRNRVFPIVRGHAEACRVDAVVVEKRKTTPPLRADVRFYPEMLGRLIRAVIEGRDLSDASQIIVITDRIPVNKKRRAVEKAIKQTLAEALPDGMRYRIAHHDSRSCCGLQVADYVNWAIYKKWNHRDLRSYTIIESLVAREYDIFESVSRVWY